MQFWKQDMVQSADTESREEAEQLLVRNNCKLLSVHSRQLRYRIDLNCTKFYRFSLFLPEIYPIFSIQM